MEAPAEPVIEVRGLRIGFPTPGGRASAVRGVDLDIRPGRILALVGESGSGKSVTALSLLGEVRAPGEVEAGTVRHRGRDVFAMDARERNALRGGRIAMVFQDPMNSLDPVMTVGAQLVEALRVKHRGLDRRAARARAVELLALVGIPAPERRFHDHPMALSGGMRQRVMIALAMSGDPDVLVADEPTTALDVTVQRQILGVFARLNREYGTAVVLVTHSFGVVAEICHEVAVMYAGRIVERAPVPEVFATARHPYTRALIDAVPHVGADRSRLLPVIPGAPPSAAEPEPGCAFAPRCGRADARCRAEDPALADRADGPGAAACWHPVTSPAGIAAETGERPRAAVSGSGPALAGRGLVRHHRVRARLLGGTGGVVHAVDGVSLDVAAGETLGIVGESGCGKSSLARLLVRADDPGAGTVEAGGEDATRLTGRRLARFRRTVQMIFQDPRASLDPRMTVGALLAEPLAVHGIEPDRAARRKRAAELLAAVGLPEDALDRRPRQFSGGQLQRVCVARALAVDPRVLVCDEPVSALDVSLQGQVVNLLGEVQAERGLAVVFISHDVGLVRYFADRIAVMYLGAVVETGPAEHVVDSPLHPYTRSLVDSVPEPPRPGRPARERRGPALTGDLPSPLDPPAGCRFHPRCPIGPAHREGRERCATEAPHLRDLGDGRRTACHFAEELLRPEG